VSCALLLFCQVLGISELRLLVEVCLKGDTSQHFSIPSDYVLPCHKKELRRPPDFERAF
jgi:hypothetical protein